MNPQDLLKNVNIEKIATDGNSIYQTIKTEYEPDAKGKFLAIDIDSTDRFLALTSAEAVIKAQETHPGKVFYVVKVGFDAAETLASLITSK